MLKIGNTGEALPFGYAHDDWLMFKEEMRPGDEIYHLKHETEKLYQTQHILVRDDCIVGLIHESNS